MDSTIGIFSLYWNNVDSEIVAWQKRVFDKIGFSINQHNINGVNHGSWIDDVMKQYENVDVYLFLDIDCVPLSKEALNETFKAAQKYGLAGAEGAANHLDPNKNYIAAWYVAISRSMWLEKGKPSAMADENNDVCQRWTEEWRKDNSSLVIYQPIKSIIPRWDLPNRKLAYGIGTQYENICFHLFESRERKHTEYFISECKKIISEKA